MPLEPLHQEEIVLESDQYSIAGNAGSLSDQGEPPAGDGQSEASFLAVPMSDLSALMSMTGSSTLSGGPRDWNAIQYEVFGMHNGAVLYNEDAEMPGATECNGQIEEEASFIAKETHVDDEMLLDHLALYDPHGEQV
jgi:hypothetical protein